MRNGEYLKREALIRHYLHEKTEDLDDETFCIRWEQTVYILKKLGMWKE